MFGQSQRGLRRPEGGFVPRRLCVRPGIVHLVKPGATSIRHNRGNYRCGLSGPRAALARGCRTAVYSLKGIYPVHGLKNIAVLGAYTQTDLLALAIELAAQTAHINTVGNHDL